MQDERLHYFVSVRHVGDHVGHVVLGGPDQSGTEHQGQVPGLHLRNRDRVSAGRIFPNTLVVCALGDLVLLRVVRHFLQVAHQELQSVEVVVWKVMELGSRWA